MTNVVGVDVSAYQGEIDFSILRTKAQFLFARAAAAKNQDAYLERNLFEARKIGMPVGMYFVPVPVGVKSWLAQAEVHAALYKSLPSQLPPVIDLESDGGMNKNDLHNWLAKYMKKFSELAQIERYEDFITYTSAGWFNGQMPLTDIFWRTELWLADWTPPPNEPLEWSNHKQVWQFWQHKIFKPATDYGCPKPPYAAYGIDLDFYNGDAAKFKAEFKVAPLDLPTIPVPPPTNLTHVKVTAGVANIRDGKDFSAVVAQAQQGAVIVTTGLDGEWFKLDNLFVHKSVVKPV